ncbi:VOC family protein [Pseudomonas aeruginosa]|uniref:VOC family protein n=1 Tax=Pseudomonas aeruginosa TaxID=287 RepID=UPI0015B99154|nr:VOC family protein [Pseudomonas aeruginosa]MBX5668828.1 VOC family protein [Pseudomonas aeruginosa]MBX5679109.1 VOC family protein [Pseudomonas aeruginosa]MBX5753432.1 VOC family protein [Pseudomonas aeruginosa]MBX6073700.1 VOC family protein [Pseudomonas aeruginosa]MBX6117702.1 VOC family protein [Pseudomonas aeruginosa]
MTTQTTTARLATAQPARHPQPTVKALTLAHLIFERPDLQQAESFLSDFGLQSAKRDSNTLYMRGTGSAPYCYRVHQAEHARFLGFGLSLASRDDLERIAQLPEASAIEPLPGPGGGERVRLCDPSGFLVEAIYGQQPAEPMTHRRALPFNLVDATPRINATQRLPVAPPEVIRLGHVVLEVADYQATCAWYTRHFGFIPSDVQVLSDGSPAVTFLRLDLGDTPADHHTLAIAQGFMAAYSHSAYELVDADAVGMGQRVLRESGWKHAWGIGRHILGSQIFDYWQDPWGDKHEHYCDGDLFTAAHPTGVHAVSPEAMSQWGQRMPKSFTKPVLNLASLRALLRNLRRSPDLTMRKLITLARMFG